MATIPSSALSPDFKRILVIRRDKVGDTIMASAAVKLLRSAYPSAFIAVLVSTQCRDLLDDPSVVDMIIEDNPPVNKFRYSLYKTLQALRLRFQRFDVCFCLGETASNAKRLKRFAGIPVRVCPSHKGGMSEGLEPYCTHVIDTKTSLGRHVVEYCQDIIRAGTHSTASERPWIAPLPEGLVSKEVERIATASSGKRIALCMQSSKNNLHRWPRESLLALVAMLGESGFSLFALVAPGDEEYMEEVSRETSVPIDVIQCRTLGICMKLLLAMDLLVSVDSGQVHMAAALGMPVLSLAGPTVAETYPYAVKALALAASPGCLYDCPLVDKCAANKVNGRKPRGDFCPPCMRALSPEIVYEYALKMLEHPEQSENYHFVR